MTLARTRGKSANFKCRLKKNCPLRIVPSFTTHAPIGVVGGTGLAFASNARAQHRYGFQTNMVFEQARTHSFCLEPWEASRAARGRQELVGPPSTHVDLQFPAPAFHAHPDGGPSAKLRGGLPVARVHCRRCNVLPPRQKLHYIKPSLSALQGKS